MQSYSAFTTAISHSEDEVKKLHSEEKDDFSKFIHEFKDQLAPVEGLKELIKDRFTLKLALTGIEELKRRFPLNTSGVTLTEIYECYLQKYMDVCLSDRYRRGEQLINYLEIYCKKKQHSGFSKIMLEIMRKKANISEIVFEKILNPPAKLRLEPLFEKVNSEKTEILYKIKEQNILSYLSQRNYKPTEYILNSDAIHEMADDKMATSEKIISLYSDPLNLNKLLNDLGIGYSSSGLQEVTLKTCDNLQELYFQNDRIKNSFQKVWGNDPVSMKSLQQLMEEHNSQLKYLKSSINIESEYGKKDFENRIAAIKKDESGRLQTIIVAKGTYEHMRRSFAPVLVKPTTENSSPKISNSTFIIFNQEKTKKTDGVKDLVFKSITT